LTHTLHRKGIEEDLKRDYVILAMLAAGVNDKYDDSRAKMIKIVNLVRHYSFWGRINENWNNWNGKYG
jgi:hypothetical protein